MLYKYLFYILYLIPASLAAVQLHWLLHGSSLFTPCRGRQDVTPLLCSAREDNAAQPAQGCCVSALGDVMLCTAPCLWSSKKQPGWRGALFSLFSPFFSFSPYPPFSPFSLLFSPFFPSPFTSLPHALSPGPRCWLTPVAERLRAPRSSSRLLTKPRLLARSAARCCHGPGRCSQPAPSPRGINQEVIQKAHMLLCPVLSIHMCVT